MKKVIRWYKIQSHENNSDHNKTASPKESVALTKSNVFDLFPGGILVAAIYLQATEATSETTTERTERLCFSHTKPVDAASKTALRNAAYHPQLMESRTVYTA